MIGGGQHEPREGNTERTHLTTKSRWGSNRRYSGNGETAVATPENAMAGNTSDCSFPLGNRTRVSDETAVGQKTLFFQRAASYFTDLRDTAAICGSSMRWLSFCRIFSAGYLSS
jgi:hypothetical protein